MKKMLVLCPELNPHGGGQAVGAWVLQALRRASELSVPTWDAPKRAAINRLYGTDRKARDFRTHLPPAPVRRAVALASRSPLRLLRTSALMRMSRRLHRRQAYDVPFAVDTEADFGCRGMQYISFPYAHVPSDRSNPHGSTPGVSGSTAFYTALCGAISGLSHAGVRSNRTFVNSHSIAEAVRAAHDIPSTVISPPVPGGFPDVPWEEREQAFVSIGRIARIEQWEDALEIVRRLRDRGWRTHLHLVGTREDEAYESELRRVADAHPELFRLSVDLPRHALVELVARHRYGLHPPVGEHFGIAVAEMQRAGCLPFVSSTGGPMEIVDGESQLTFGSMDEAVAKIDAVLARPELGHELRMRARTRASWFTAERFTERVRDFRVGDGERS